MNSVILMGRLTREPELRYTTGGSARAFTRFSLAVDRNYSKEQKQEVESKNQPTVDFINIVCWGKLAENVVKFTGKGRRVIINGRIQTGSYVDKDGKRVYTTDVVASNVEFIDWREGGASTGAPDFSDQFSAAPLDEDFQYSADFDPISDDGRIPF